MAPSRRQTALPGLDAHTLSTIVDGLASADPAAFLPAGDCRRWALIASTDAYSAWVIAWPGGTGLGLHDHDGSAAAIRVVAGQLRERYVAGGELTTRWLDAGTRHVLAGDHHHEMINVGSVEAISVHVYSPPLRDTTFRDDPEIDLR